MFRVIISLAVFVATCGMAAAGPWARDPGDVFLSYTLSADTTQDNLANGTFDGQLFHSVYGEVGVGRRITLVFDLGRDTDTTLGSAFGQYTFTRNASVWQVAAELGLGWVDTVNREPAELYRAGLSVGRGFQRRELGWVPFFEPESGWFTVNSNIQIDPDGTQTTWESEATFGLFVNDRFGGLLQIQAEEFADDDLAVYLSPGLLIRFGTQATAQIGGRFGIEGSDDVGLRAAIWQDF